MLITKKLSGQKPGATAYKAGFACWAPSAKRKNPGISGIASPLRFLHLQKACIPVVEAMFYGKPVFLSDHASLPEIGGSEAYYFTDFDSTAMQEVFNRGIADYQSQGKAEKIRQRALHYSWDQAAQDYLAIYRKWNTI